MDSINSYNYQNRFVQDIPTALTFDDILLVPQYSEIQSRSQCQVTSRFSKNVPLNLPIVSSPMDTVTEFKLAKEMARCGGLGIIHRFMSVEDQVREVSKVKRAQANIIMNPVVITKKTTLREIENLADQYTFQTFLVQEGDAQDHIIENNSTINNSKFSPRKKSSCGEIQKSLLQLAGIITRRDIKNMKNLDDTVEKYMTKRENLHIIEVNKQPDNFEESDIGSIDKVLSTLYEKRIEKIPIVTSDNIIIGMITQKDIERNMSKPVANIDHNGKLYVGAAIGANKDYLERAAKLVQADCNVLVLDVANGHSTIAIDALKLLKEQFEDIDIVAGSIATGEGALNLIKAGADGIRCGIGNGSICITRMVAGSGVPQFSALMDVAPVCKEFDIPLISDGGNKCSGNMAKALAVGADCVMLGRLVAGTDESPSQVIYRDGKLQKVYRGMAGYGANLAKAKRTGDNLPETDKFTPEGVEGYTPYSGPLANVIQQFSQGIKSGMSYSGAFNIKDFQKKAKFLRITQSGYKESNVHSVNKI